MDSFDDESRPLSFCSFATVVLCCLAIFHRVSPCLTRCTEVFGVAVLVLCLVAGGAVTGAFSISGCEFAEESHCCPSLTGSCRNSSESGSW